ncbi:hypothetical protein ATCC90586_004067 [Pythium insidiosum]|nr:hypothetical protein ATCC90586_004067 [Pythium insidiosum]
MSASLAPSAKARRTRHRDAATSRPPSGSRVSTGSPDATSDADEDEDDENESGAAAASAGSKRKRPSSQAHEEDTRIASMEDSGSQAELAEPDTPQAGVKPEMGIIEEIYCENFMCHRKMRVKLSPHINFITGENGSGKSAIIAAIQICLGASARSTHRGKSIKNLIRHGHDGNALVRITLRNDGKDTGDAFRAEVFGKRIMVERLIRRDGSAEYRLKDQNGSLVSKLKTDLDAMLDHLNIQTENPCAILDQENAKLFLKGNPIDKYKFFLQSTDLYKMRNTLEEELADDVQQHTLDTTVLEDEIEEARKELLSIKDREVELNELMYKFNPDLEGRLKELEDLSNEEQEIAGELAELQEDVDSLYKHLSEMKVQEVRYEREAAAASEFVTQWETELAAIQDECDALAEKAKQHCGSDHRIEVQESPDYYGKRLTDIKLKIDKERSRFQGMDLDELRLDKEEKELKFQKKKTTFDRFSENLRCMRSMLERRKQDWQILRREIAHRTSMEFNKYMYYNNFAGKLKFRHDDQRLEIAVLHNEKGRSRASQVTDMKELSGGERSYTQVSLLLALGESIECPFRVMDEFDVFMDSVNRDMTIQLLVEAAKKDGKKQFIFVTPNDLSALRKDPMVKIQKMDPPRDRLNAER